MKLGIISDTHNHLELTKKMVQKLLDEEIAYLIHAGDIGEDVAIFLASLPIKTIAVYGNTDSALAHPKGNLILQKQPYYFKIASTTFKLMHQPYFLSPDSDIIIYGHLHKFSCQRAKALFLNPGEVCAREKPLSEGAILHMDDFSVEYIYYSLEKQQFHKEAVCQ